MANSACWFQTPRYRTCLQVVKHEHSGLAKFRPCVALVALRGQHCGIMDCDMCFLQRDVINSAISCSKKTHRRAITCAREKLFDAIVRKILPTFSAYSIFCLLCITKVTCQRFIRCIERLADTLLTETTPPFTDEHPQHHE